jgi:tRNA (uracil-5-)-methyltransferase
MKRPRTNVLEIFVRTLVPIPELKKSLKDLAFKIDGKNPILILSTNESKIQNLRDKLQELKIDVIKKSIQDQVTPLAFMPYSDQIKYKTEVMRSIVSTLSEMQKKEISFEGLLESPQINGYRNNNEFTCGVDEEGTPRVGFLKGAFKDGYMTIGSAMECLHISEKDKDLASHFETLIRSMKWPTYRKETASGFWRLLKTRHTIKDEFMAIVQINPIGMEEKDLEEIKTCLVKHMSEKVTSLYLQKFDGLSNSAPEDTPMECIFGSSTIVETLKMEKEYHFQIRPQSFFQVNTLGTQVLYKLVSDWTEKKDILLDLCCGTGTIGILMSSGVKRVIGVEMSSSAVDDAKENAKQNKIENIEFICGKLEDVLPRLILTQQLDKKSVCAVLDPPRGGLHPKVCKTLLKCDSIKEFVYVSCNQNSLIENFRLLSDKFIITKTIGVDLFPHTIHCEMIAYFVRK